MSWFKKYWFLLILFILALVLIILKVTYKDNNSNKVGVNNNQNNELIGKTQPETNEITNPLEDEDKQSVTIGETKTNLNKSNSTENTFVTNEGETINANDYKSEDLSDSVNVDDLSPFLPYQGKYFKVERYLNTGYLEIIVDNENNFSKANGEVESWLKDNNTDSQETQLVYVFKN